MFNQFCLLFLHNFSVYFSLLVFPELATHVNYVCVHFVTPYFYIVHITEIRLSPSPFVFCEIYEYCMTFEERASPDNGWHKSLFFQRLSP